MLAGSLPEEDHLYEALRLSGADDDSYVRFCRATGHREKASISGAALGEKRPLKRRKAEQLCPSGNTGNYSKAAESL